MILTEKEAKLKACPIDPNDFQCIASDCMAWRWHTTKETAPGGGFLSVDLPGDKKTGYCGMAGRP